MQETLDDIFAVIVLYKTDLKNSVTFNTLIKAVDQAPGTIQLLLYNNSPEIKIDTGYHPGNKISFTLIEDNANTGVSKAYNIANGLAKEQKRKWLLLLDQDTALPPDFFRSFFYERENDAHNAEKLYFPIIVSSGKIISPAMYIPYRGIIKRKVNTGSREIKNLAIINSGTIVNTDLFDKAGGFNEQVNLDFSDVSFFRRVKKICNRGTVLNSRCAHEFSGSEYNDREKILTRFKIFNDNAIAFSKEEGVCRICVFVTLMVRAINLSLKFKTLNYIKALKFY